MRALAALVLVAARLLRSPNSAFGDVFNPQAAFGAAGTLDVSVPVCSCTCCSAVDEEHCITRIPGMASGIGGDGDVCPAPPQTCAPVKPQVLDVSGQIKEVEMLRYCVVECKVDLQGACVALFNPVQEELSGDIPEWEPEVSPIGIAATAPPDPPTEPPPAPAVGDVVVSVTEFEPDPGSDVVNEDVPRSIAGKVIETNAEGDLTIEFDDAPGERTVVEQGHVNQYLSMDPGAQMISATVAAAKALQKTVDKRADAAEARAKEAEDNALGTRELVAEIDSPGKH